MKPSKTKFYGTYSAIKAGERGAVMILPRAFCKINSISPGSKLDVYIVDGDGGYLIIQPHKVKGNGGK